MEPGTLIMSIVLVGICILPFALAEINSRRKKAHLLKILNKMADEHQSRISKYELCSDFGMALDSDSKYLFFYKKSNKYEISRFIDLNEYKTAKAIKNFVVIQNGRSDQRILDKIGMLFIPIYNNKPEEFLEFYDLNQSNQLSDELKFAEEWTKRINMLLKNSEISKSIKQPIRA